MNLPCTLEAGGYAMDIIVEIFKCEEEICDIKVQYEHLRLIPYEPAKHEDLVGDLHGRYIKVRNRLHELRKKSGTKYSDRINQDIEDLITLARRVDTDTRFLEEIGDSFKKGSTIEEIEEAWVPKWKIA